MLLFVVGSQATEEPVLAKSDVEAGTNGTTLIVLLHGYTLDGQSLASVQDTLKRIKDLAGSDVLKPDLPLDTFSMASSSRITAELLLAIDKAWQTRAKAGRPYERIVMVGHSVGGLYARKVYAAACGENPEAPFEPSLKADLLSLKADPVEQTRDWAGAVDRIVLLAGMNRGWSISHHMSITTAVRMRFGVGIGHVLKWRHGRPPVIFTIRRGAPFITELRLQWLEMRKKVTEKGAGGAATVQLLGTIDDLVSPDDNVDLVSGEDFVYLEVPASGHKNVIDMDNSDAGLKRQRALYEAFAVDPDSTNTIGPITSSISVQPKVKDVVFVIHGIRDEGYWTRKIAYRAQRAGGGVRVATETSSYGYFPMLSFLRPGARQEKVEWLMDRYTEAKAIYPNARFHYFGHSHGTYLLAKALEDYPAVHFDQVIFAGSVVRRDYAWHKLMPHRVKSVVNFVATADWVVAFFPNALQSVGFQDLGSAGHHGFDDAQTNSGLIQPPQMYVTGGHGAALQEAMWDSIAEFIVTGNFRPPPSALLSSTQAKWVVWPARVAPLWWIVIAGLLAWGGYELATLPVREWKKTLALVAYCFVIWTVLTRV